MPALDHAGLSAFVGEDEHSAANLLTGVSHDFHLVAALGLFQSDAQTVAHGSEHADIVAHKRGGPIAGKNEHAARAMATVDRHPDDCLGTLFA